MSTHRYSPIRPKQEYFSKTINRIFMSILAPFPVQHLQKALLSMSWSCWERGGDYFQGRRGGGGGGWGGGGGGGGGGVLQFLDKK